MRRTAEGKSRLFCVSGGEEAEFETRKLGRKSEGSAYSFCEAPSLPITAMQLAALLWGWGFLLASARRTMRC